MRIRNQFRLRSNLPSRSGLDSRSRASSLHARSSPHWRSGLQSRVSGRNSACILVLPQSRASTIPPHGRKYDGEPKHNVNNMHRITDHLNHTPSGSAVAQWEHRLSEKAAVARATPWNSMLDHLLYTPSGNAMAAVGA